TQSDEHLRVWTIRLLGDGKSPSAAAVREFGKLVPHEKSGLVLLYLASTLQQLPAAARWPLAAELARRCYFAAARVLPLMVWSGIESAVPEDPAQALRIASETSMFKVVQYIS